MGQFAEDEIVISSGPAKGKFSLDTQPYARVWFALISLGIWNRFFCTGCVQSGKTLCGFVIPILYYLFETQEPVICLVPDGDMAKKKWLEDLLPAIRASRFRDMLPVKGAGSKGGAVSVIYFKNGTFLQFMTGKGSDKSRAGATARVVVMTEIDGMDEAGDASRETDPVSQVEARTESHAERKQIHGECTTSIETGRTWTEYTKGTQTRLVVECCKCRSWVTPEREDLHGWQDAANEIEADRRSSFACPDCGVLWSDAERFAMLRNVRALHRGQTIKDGVIEGEPPETKTLGFRWNAFFNAFWKTGFIGSKEYLASKADSTDAAEKERLQYAWAKPYIPDVEATVNISVSAVMSRTTPLKQCAIPSGTIHLSAGMDLGQYWNHWVLLAWFANASPHVVDYGSYAVRSPVVGVEMATTIALREFRDVCEFGWLNPDGSKRSPDRVLIDSGFQSHEVYAFIREFHAGRYWSADGQGTAQDGSRVYTTPAKVGGDILLIHDGYHIKKLVTGPVVQIDSNEWKTWVHKRIVTPIGQPGALTLFQGDGNTHLEFAKHLTSEQQVDEFIPGRGVKTLWKKKQRKNHWFDALYYACVAGHLAGVRLIPNKPQEKPVIRPVEAEKQPFVRPVETRESDGGWIRRRTA